MLQCPEGRVPLNESAVTILRLCNGAHSREEIIAEVSGHADGGALAADVSAFLDAARTRGWIV
jgi:pyrroloquinoline quinone biosynthesis protein D